MAVVRSDWKIKPFPSETATIPLDRRYSLAEFERLKAGRLPESMDERWFLFYEEPWLNMHRSWTGFGVFRVRFEVHDEEARAVEVIASRDAEQYRFIDAADDLQMAATLLDSYAGRVDP